MDTRTKTKTVPRFLVENALDGADYDEIMDSYSGRGMYDSACFAVTLSSQRDLNRFMFGLGREAQAIEDEDGLSDGDAIRSATWVNTLEDLARNAMVDSMGLGIVVYFPRFTLED